MIPANAIVNANPDPERLRKLIYDAGYTQEQIAILAGVSKRSIERAVSDGCTYPLQYLIESICAQSLRPLRTAKQRERAGLPPDTLPNAGRRKPRMRDKV